MDVFALPGDVRPLERPPPVVHEAALAPAHLRSPGHRRQARDAGRRQALPVLQQRHRRLRAQVIAL